MAKTTVRVTRVVGRAGPDRRRLGLEEGLLGARLLVSITCPAFCLVPQCYDGVVSLSSCSDRLHACQLAKDGTEALGCAVIGAAVLLLEAHCAALGPWRAGQRGGVTHAQAEDIVGTLPLRRRLNLKSDISAHVTPASPKGILRSTLQQGVICLDNIEIRRMCSSKRKLQDSLTSL
jgi:hypothetical protein